MSRSRPPAAGRRVVAPILRTTLLVLVVVVTASCGGSGGAGRDASESSTPVEDATVPSSCGDATAPRPLTVEVVSERPHDPTAFTEGLLLVGGTLYESTGLEGESSVRAVDPATGQVRDRTDLPADEFGEGLTAVGPDRLVQLTWKSGRALVWDRSDLTLVGEHRYEGEGWGITTLDDGRLVMSDGSDRLTVRDPTDFSVLERWTVERVGGDADQINELESDGTHVWANRWKTDEIVRIDVECHRIDEVVDASSLAARAEHQAIGEIDVLNGIAHIAGTDRFLVTGKDWPVMFEVRFVPS